MKVRWTPQAEQDRHDVWDYIASASTLAAVRMDALFGNAAAQLGDFPYIGQIGGIVGTRELIVHENYRLVYEIADETVWILVLIHVARQWPPVGKSS